MTQDTNPILTKEVQASKDVIDILWNEKKKIIEYIDQLKRNHQSIAESLALILGVEINYDN